jgi:hypothetical protein
LIEEELRGRRFTFTGGQIGEEMAQVWAAVEARKGAKGAAWEARLEECI